MGSAQKRGAESTVGQVSALSLLLGHLLCTGGLRLCSCLEPSGPGGSLGRASSGVRAGWGMGLHTPDTGHPWLRSQQLLAAGAAPAQPCPCAEGRCPGSGQQGLWGSARGGPWWLCGQDSRPLAPQASRRGNGLVTAPRVGAWRRVARAWHRVSRGPVIAPVAVQCCPDCHVGGSRQHGTQLLSAAARRCSLSEGGRRGLGEAVLAAGP